MEKHYMDKQMETTVHNSHNTEVVGGFKHFLFSISYMGCHPSPIDELILHHFSKW